MHFQPVHRGAGAVPVLEPLLYCNNNNSSPLHAVGLAAITQVARHDQEPPRDFPGVLPGDVVVQLPSPNHERHRPRYQTTMSV